MSSKLNAFKYISTSPTTLTTQEPPQTEPKQHKLFNIKVPGINSIINSSSGFVSGIIDLAGNLWEKTKAPPEKPAEHDYEEESSDSIVYDSSPDILILNRDKVHGRKERFSREFGINPKKLRIGRYSEHIPTKRLELQIDEDVQPQITTLRESILIQRNRTESCYPRLQHQRSSNVELRQITLQSGDSILYDKTNVFEEACEDEYLKIIIDESKIGSPVSIQAIMELTDDKNYSHLDLPNLQSYVINKPFEEEQDELEKEGLNCKSCIEERSEIEEMTEFNASCMGQIHPEPSVPIDYIHDLSRQRSIDSIIVSIDGKIFNYFDKTQLCSIPVYTFEQILERLRGIPVTTQKPWFKSRFTLSVCCLKPKPLPLALQRDLEKIIALSLAEYNFTDEFHLILLLGAYASATGVSDWPSNSTEWLDMGFSSTDLAVELKDGGPLGLLFTFYLSTHFSKFFREMLEVSRYYSFEVFQVCKKFACDVVKILRSMKLHACFKEANNDIEILFLFYAGMIMHWFSLVVKNKDFNEVYENVLIRARSNPKEFIMNAQKIYSNI